MHAQRPRIRHAVIAGVLLLLALFVRAAANAQETNEIPPLDPGDARDPTDVVMESANKALVRAFSNSEDLARYFIDAFNWLVGRVSKGIILIHICDIRYYPKSIDYSLPVLILQAYTGWDGAGGLSHGLG